jgi:hypothetical protein
VRNILACAVKLTPDAEKPEWAQFVGIRYGNTDRHHVYLFQRDHQTGERTLVIKVNGGQIWSGVGIDRTYVPGRFMVFRITRDGRDWIATQVLEIPLRQPVK